jgi:hypothetical protein
MRIEDGICDASLEALVQRQQHPTNAVRVLLERIVLASQIAALSPQRVSFVNEDVVGRLRNTTRSPQGKACAASIPSSKRFAQNERERGEGSG